MGRPTKGPIPTSRTISNHARDLGAGVKCEYFRLRDGYKAKGLTAREAVERACIELRIMERWKDWHERQQLQKAMGSAVPVTPGEMRAAVPSYELPRVSQATDVGDQEMSLAEQVAWAKRWSARVQNGEEPPTRFPSEGALFWFQSALANRRDFERVVLRVENPAGDGENLYLQDGQYQLKEIEAQLKEALRECGERLVEMESGFAELLADAQASASRE